MSASLVRVVSAIVYDRNLRPQYEEVLAAFTLSFCICISQMLADCLYYMRGTMGDSTSFFMNSSACEAYMWGLASRDQRESRRWRAAARRAVLS